MAEPLTAARRDHRLRATSARDLIDKVAAATRSSSPGWPASTRTRRGLRAPRGPGSSDDGRRASPTCSRACEADRARVRCDLGARARRPRGAARRARDPLDRPHAGRARPGRRAVGQPRRPRRRARRQPDHLRRPGDRAHRRRARGRPRSQLRGDRLDDLRALGRPRHAAEHRRVHAGDGGGARDRRRRAARQGDHPAQPGRAADHDAQHDLCRAGGRRAEADATQARSSEAMADVAAYVPGLPSDRPPRSSTATSSPC